MTRRGIIESTRKAIDTLPGLSQVERDRLKRETGHNVHGVRRHILRVIDKLDPERKRELRLAEIEAMTGWTGSTTGRRLAQARREMQYNLHGRSIRAVKLKSSRGGNRLRIATYDLAAIEEWLRAEYPDTWDQIERLRQQRTSPKLADEIQSLDDLNKPMPYLINVKGKIYAHIATVTPKQSAALLDGGLEIMNLSMFDALLRCEWTSSVRREPVSAIFARVMSATVHRNDARGAARRAEDLKERKRKKPQGRKVQTRIHA